MKGAEKKLPGERNMISFWDIMDRAYRTGPLMRQKNFDMSIFKKVNELKETFDLLMGGEDFQCFSENWIKRKL